MDCTWIELTSCTIVFENDHRNRLFKNGVFSFFPPLLPVLPTAAHASNSSMAVNMIQSELDG